MTPQPLKEETCFSWNPGSYTFRTKFSDDRQFLAAEYRMPYSETRQDNRPYTLVWHKDNPWFGNRNRLCTAILQHAPFTGGTAFVHQLWNHLKIPGNYFMQYIDDEEEDILVYRTYAEYAIADCEKRARKQNFPAYET